MQCIAFTVQLGQSYSKLQAKDTDVLVIGGGGVGRAQVLAKSSRLPFPVLADADRSVYEQYRLGTKLLLVQQSGLVVVDKAGAVRLYHRYTNPGSWMRNSEIAGVMQVIDQLEQPI